jgi:hypothetical protein
MSESTWSVLTFAAEMALSRVAWARTSSTPSGARASASQYQPPVDSTTALWGPGNAAKYGAKASAVLATRACLTRGPSGP